MTIARADREVAYGQVMNRPISRPPDLFGLPADQRFLAGGLLSRTDCANPFNVRAAFTMTTKIKRPDVASYLQRELAGNVARKAIDLMENNKPNDARQILDTIPRTIPHLADFAEIAQLALAHVEINKDHTTAISSRTEPDSFGV